MIFPPLDKRMVSVVIPTYNCASLLPKAIASAYAQDWSPLEVIVVNDGSTDNTADVVRDLAKTLPDNFIYEYKANGGEGSARNRGVALAKGNYVAFLDQDDVWLADKLAQQMELFDRDSALGLTFTAYTRVSESSRELVCLSEWHSTSEWALRQLIEGSCMTPSTVVVRREVLIDVGPFDESLWLGCDWDMWLRIAAYGYRTGYLASPLTDYLWHSQNMSRDLMRVAQAAQVIFPRLFGSGKLPPAIQRLERYCYARWSLIHACYCLEGGDARNARKHLINAFRTRPASARPGWVFMFMRSLLMKPRSFIIPVEAALGGREKQ